MKPEVVRCVVLADRHHDLTEGIRGLLETAFDPDQRSQRAECLSGGDGGGTDAFVLKRAIATQLLPAVDAVLAGNRYTSPDASIHPSSDERRENF